MTHDTLAPSPDLQVLTTPLPSPLDRETILSSTIHTLEKHLSLGLKRVGIEFEENDLSCGLEYRNETRTISKMGTRRIEVSAVRGSNEGIYIHIRLVTDTTTKLCMTGKTYSRLSAATLVTALTSLLSHFTLTSSSTPSSPSKADTPRFPQLKSRDDISPPSADSLVFSAALPNKIPGDSLYGKTIHHLTDTLCTALAALSITFDETPLTTPTTLIPDSPTLDDLHIRWLESSVTPIDGDTYELRVRALSRTTDIIVMSARIRTFNTALRTVAATTILLSDY